MQRTEEDIFHPDILVRRLYDITHGDILPNGEAGLFERLAAEVERTDWTAQEVDLFNQAIDDMVRIHDGDMRGDHHSYVHMLRGAIRLISEGEQYFGVRTRPDLVIAYLLHDSVEDFPERWLTEDQLQSIDLSTREGKLAAQQMAFASIEQRYQKTIPDGMDSNNDDGYVNDANFGHCISTVVSWMTSKPYPETLGENVDTVEYQKRKWASYETGVRQIFLQQDAYGAKALKAIDIIENFIGGMRHHEKPEKRAIHARKYIYLVDVLVDYIRTSHIIPEDRKAYQIERLISAFTEAKCIIAQHIENYPEDKELFDTSPNETDRVLGRHAITIMFPQAS